MVQSLTCLVIMATASLGDSRFDLLGQHAVNGLTTKSQALTVGVGKELECGSMCGADSTCGAFYIDETQGSQHGDCILVDKDSNDAYKNTTNLVNSTSNYYI